MKVLVTGASGVLGRAVFNAFAKSDDHSVEGLAFSNTSDIFVRLDLLDPLQIATFITDHKPDWVIHCAAERRPDIAEKNKERTRKLNAEVPGHLARLSASSSYPFTLIHISTDYVFDGTEPPYEVNANPRPVNTYGMSKWEGEKTVLDKNLEGQPGARVVLRVPVLYGPCPKNSDTAINILIDVVQDQSGKQYKMDDYAIRYPTNVLDIADFLVRLTAVQQKLPPILHYSSEEKYTKYEICTVLSGILGLPSSHIIADRTEPPPDLAVSRPKNCQLSTKIITSSIEEAGLGMGFQCRKLEKWFTTYLTQSTT